VRVRFTPRAQRHLARIHAYIANRNPVAARRVIRRIRETVHILGEFPFIGHHGLVPNTREKNVKGLPYVIVYRVETVDRREVVVLAVFHGAQDRERAED
jgi:toxin ParE1/3/4